MLAFSSGEIMNISKFATALDVSQPTIKKYFEIAEGFGRFSLQNRF
jgi:hypothetical protein